MNEVCPVCNGLYEKSEVCSQCGGLMIQAGRIEDYNGPYSPYMGKETFLYNNKNVITGDNCCIHLYECPNCSVFQHGSVQLISI